MNRPEYIRLAVVSVIVYLEVLGLALLLRAAGVAPNSDPLRLMNSYFGWFLFGAVLMIVAFGPPPASFPRLKMRALRTHLLMLVVSAIILFGIAALVRPLPPGHPVLGVVRTDGIPLNEFTVRVGIPSLILFSCMHGTLLLTAVDIRRAALRYGLAVPVSILLRILYPAATKLFVNVLGTYLVTGAARLVYICLSTLGFRTSIEAGENAPVVGTDQFRVAISHPCSGLEGIMTFMVALAFLFLFQREQLDWRRTITLAYMGVFLMYVANVVRVVILILIGHFYNPVFAVDLWHSQGSTVFYALVIALILGCGYAWIRKDSVKKRQEPISPAARP